MHNIMRAPDTGSNCRRSGYIYIDKKLDYRNLITPGPRIGNHLWSKFDPVLFDDKFNKIQPTAPLFSNEIN